VRLTFLVFVLDEVLDIVLGSVCCTLLDDLDSREKLLIRLPILSFASE
jgi:hypothetical protein